MALEASGNLKIKHPTSEELRAIRRAAKISQSKAASLVHLGDGRRWSDYETGKRNIDPARFELLLIKIGFHAKYAPKDA
jgi:transcriptional regulator with XRE-family HTH domain